MPIQVERCVQSLLAKWKKDPKSRPTPKKGTDGKPQKAKQQAFAICQAAQKQEATGSIFLEWANPVITGLALTNRPHIKNLDAISILEDGLLKVPLLILGKWRHPTGVLDFTKEVIAKMVKGFEENVVGHDISVDNRHRPELGAMGWVKRFGMEQRTDGKLQFSAFAEPTPEGQKTVEEKRYRYGSLEFYTNWKHPLVAALSSDELVEYSEELEEVIMTEEVLVEGDENQNTENLEAKLEEQQTQHAEALRLEEERRVALEARVRQLEDRAKKQFVDNILLRAEAYRDDEQRAHSKVLMDWARATLLEEPLGEEEAIKLEDRNSVEQVRAYHRRAIALLLESLPGVVPMAASGTEPGKGRKLEDEDYEPTDEQIKEFWEM